MIDQKSDESLKDSYRILSLILLIGFIMAMGMLFMSFTTDEEVISLDSPKDPVDIGTTITENQTRARLFIMLDTFFIIGYTGLFIGLYLMLRSSQEFIAKVSLMFGLMVTVGDIMENSLLFALIKGIPKGWDPDPSVYVFLWFLGIFIDTCSYVAGILFGASFIVTRDRMKDQRILGILLFSYSVVGFLAYHSSLFVLVRSFFFVIGLLYATLIFWRISK